MSDILKIYRCPACRSSNYLAVKDGDGVKFTCLHCGYEYSTKSKGERKL